MGAAADAKAGNGTAVNGTATTASTFIDFFRQDGHCARNFSGRLQVSGPGRIPMANPALEHIGSLRLWGVRNGTVVEFAPNATAPTKVVITARADIREATVCDLTRPFRHVHLSIDVVQGKTGGTREVIVRQ